MVSINLWIICVLWYSNIPMQKNYQAKCVPQEESLVYSINKWNILLTQTEVCTDNILQSFVILIIN